MSLIVETLIVPERFYFSSQNKKGLRFATQVFYFEAVCQIDGKRGKLTFGYKEKCPYNGASNPLNWPIKNYYDEPIKDACGLGHDTLYAWGGEVTGLGRKLKAGECDDYIRGAMREAGFSRKEAGLVDMAVRYMSHLLHFGKNRDKDNMHSFCSVEWDEFK